MEFEKKPLYRIPLLKFVRSKPDAYVTRLTAVHLRNSPKRFRFRKLSKLWRVNKSRSNTVSCVRYLSKGSCPVPRRLKRGVARRLRKVLKFQPLLGRSLKRIFNSKLLFWIRWNKILRKKPWLGKRLWEYRNQPLLRKGLRIISKSLKYKNIVVDDVYGRLVKTSIKFPRNLIEVLTNNLRKVFQKYPIKKGAIRNFNHFQPRARTLCSILWDITKSIKKLKGKNHSLKGVPQEIPRVLQKYIKDRKARRTKMAEDVSKFHQKQRAFEERRLKRVEKKKQEQYLKDNTRYDKKPLLNSLKRKIKFQLLEKENFRKSRVYFKYTGSNIFLTVTNNLGEVAFVYSAGIFQGLRTRKEKTTIFVAQQLGELLSLRLYKTNAKEVFFILFINHRKARGLVKFFVRGLKAVDKFKFNKVIFKRRVMRNGVRLAKPRRK